VTVTAARAADQNPTPVMAGAVPAAAAPAANRCRLARGCRSRGAARFVAIDRRGRRGLLAGLLGLGGLPRRELLDDLKRVSGKQNLLLEGAQKSWRRLDGHNQLSKLALGVTFNDWTEVIVKPTDRQPTIAAA